MNVYTINLLIMGLWVIIHKIFFPKSPQKLAIFFTIQLMILISMRDIEILGVDLIRYSRTYERIKNMEMIDSIFYAKGKSALYYLSNWIFSKMGFSFHIYVSFVSIMCVAVFGRYIYKYSKEVVLSFLVYLGMGCYTFLFSGLRQGIAMAMILLCLEQYNKKCYFKTFFFFLIAILFHETSFVLIVYFLVSNIKLNKELILVYTICIYLIIYFRLPIAEAISELYNERYIQRYVSIETLSGNFIFILIFFLFYIFLYRKELQKNQLNKTISFHVFVIMLVIQAFASFAYSFTRLNLYNVQAFFTLIIPEIFEKKQWYYCFGKINIFIRLVLYILITILMLFLFYRHLSEEHLLEYSFFLK